MVEGNTDLAKEILAECEEFKNWPKEGVNFLDFFSLTRKPAVFKKLMNAVREQITQEVGTPGEAFNVIVGLDSRGFVIGPILALEWGIPFVPIRKKGKLPGECFHEGYEKEYGADQVEI